VPPLKRKFFSAIWRLKQTARASFNGTLKFVVQTLTEKYWLLDFWPTFTPPQSTLLLVKLDLIGDFVLWLDSAKVYHSIYPNHRITLAVNHSCFELARALPYWDEVVAIDVAALRANDTYRIKALSALRRRNFSITIQPTFSREFVGDLVVRATKSEQRIGYVGDFNNIVAEIKTVTDCWYTQLVQNDPLVTMELNINAHFVRNLGAVDFLSSVPEILPVTILTNGLAFKRPYIVIAPGASWQPKMWPLSHFAHLIKKLRAESNLLILLCGGSNDESICAELASLLNQDDLLNLAGKTTLLELIEIIRGADLLISNDSAPVHIAAATRTPSVCVLGGGHFERFLPYAPEHLRSKQEPLIASHKMDCYGCRWKCIYNLATNQPVPCISNVPVTDVYEACKQILFQTLNAN
jgi:ADP-heptose:LPS heptosyltransferase